MGRLCEEFNALPTQIEREPLAVLLDIVEMRSFSRTKEAVDTYDGPADKAPSGPAVDLVIEIKKHLYAEALRARSDSR